MNHWDTRPSFGVNHETRETMVVDSGFTFNGNSFTVTDNHHTPFDEQLIELGAVNTFEATVWAVKDLKVQEFLFGGTTFQSIHGLAQHAVAAPGSEGYCHCHEPFDFSGKRTIFVRFIRLVSHSPQHIGEQLCKLLQLLLAIFIKVLLALAHDCLLC